MLFNINNVLALIIYFGYNSLRVMTELRRYIVEYLVCIKQVPQVSRMKIDENNNLIREGVKTIVNPADLNALTEAIKLREKTGGRITVLTMGPPSADEALKECIAMGADRGFIVSSRDFKGSDTLATSYTLTMAAKKIGDFDIIFTGTQTIDGDTGQVGPELAENLNLNQIGYVDKVDFEDNKIIARRESKYGKQMVEAKLPILISILRDANEVIKASDENIEKAESMSFEILSPEDINADSEKIGIKGSPTVVAEVFPPEEKKTGVMISGDNTEDKVNKLVEILKEKTTLGW